MDVGESLLQSAKIPICDVSDMADAKDLVGKCSAVGAEPDLVVVLHGGDKRLGAAPTVAEPQGSHRIGGGLGHQLEGLVFKPADEAAELMRYGSDARSLRRDPA